MNPDHGETSLSRPVLFGRLDPPRDITRPGGGSPRVVFHKREQRIARLDSDFDIVLAAFRSEIELTSSLPAADPQLVLVFEALDEQIDLTGVARHLGFELIAEAESSIEPTDEYGLISQRPLDPMVGSCLHAVCLNQYALQRLLGHWRSWKRGQALPRGYAPLRELFEHLKDVRPWGPQDRLKMIDWNEHFSGQITDGPHSIEIELWYRRSPVTRTIAQNSVAALLREAGGHVLSFAVIDQIGYHGLKCEVQASTLRDLALGHFDQVQVVRSANVMYLRITGQTLPPAGQETGIDVSAGDISLPQRNPVVCILDGVPAANHPLLQGRLLVHDPDDLASQSVVTERKHGTWMASAVIWGDRSAEEDPTDRQVLMRPILSPSSETTSRFEELPFDALTPDLMRRIFRELFESVDEQDPLAPEISIINLSVGDPATPFDSIMSSWARVIDWLSYEYGVLVVVSAGNYSRLPLAPSNSAELLSLSGSERREAVLRAQYTHQMNRRIISPAESVNSVTVGALHSDSSGQSPVGYIFDPADGLISVSPITGIGGGYRRSLKPEIAAPGGRVVFHEPPTAADEVIASGVLPHGPGIRVASPGTNQETHIFGTSPAAALITRQAVNLYDVLDRVTEGAQLTKRQRTVALKALLIHGAGTPADLSSASLPLEQVMGNGMFDRDLSRGCASNEAVVLYLGSLRASQEQDLLLPLPNGLSIRETKRIVATLSWLTPVNWRHRQYRKASLSLIKPTGDIPDIGAPYGLSSGITKRGAATVQHLVWETSKAFAGGQGSNICVRVKCLEQAGGLNGQSIDYAVVLSLWIAPTLNIDVYEQVREQIRARVPIQPG